MAPRRRKLFIRNSFEKLGIDVNYSHFHNGFLNAWVEAGIVGMLALTAVFVVAAWLCGRRLRPRLHRRAQIGGGHADRACDNLMS